MNKLLILTSCAKFGLNSLGNNEITITDVFGCHHTEVTSYLGSSYDVMNCFAKFEKFLSHSIITPSFMTVGSQMPELRGVFALSIQNR